VTVSLLDRLIWMEIGGAFGFGLGLFSVLVVMNHLFYLARIVIGQGVPFAIVFALFVYRVPSLIAFCVPMGVLLATVLGVGRLGDHHEIAALRVSGASLYRICVPILLAGAAAAVGTVVFSEGVVSAANDRYRTVFNAVMTRAPQLQPVENIFFQAPTPEGNALYYAKRYSPRTRTLEDVTVVYLAGGQALRIIQAREAAYRSGGSWKFGDGEIYVLSGGNVVATKFSAMDLNVPRSPEELTLPPKPPAEMSLRELSYEIGEARRRGTDSRPYVAEFHSKLATAASCIVFALIAFPLSLRPHRSGPSIGLGLSILVLLVYYAVAIPAQLAGDGRLLPPVLAAWLPDGIVGALGVVLLARAAR